MSPLARSLLALAALLAVYAQHNCNTKIFGTKTAKTREGLTFGFPPGGGSYMVPDPCPSPCYEVGVKATACNNDTNGEAPELKQGKHVIIVDCPDGCPMGAYAKNLAYCKCLP